MIVVTGAEGSGTHMLTYMLQALAVAATQRSLPHAYEWWIDDEKWWDPETSYPYPDDVRFIVIHRRPDVRNLALLARKPPMATDIKEARAQYAHALPLLSRLPAIWVVYEAVIAAPVAQMRNLMSLLGLPLDPSHLERIEGMVSDENAKWLSFLEP